MFRSSIQIDGKASRIEGRKRLIREGRGFSHLKRLGLSVRKGS